MKLGEIFEENGKRYVVTYSDGANFSYAPFEDTVKPKAESKEEVKEDRRRKTKG